VRVVTINWNAAELTARCLRSLLATEWPADALDLVVVDNASIDGSLERLRSWFADEPVRFVPNPHNVGFAEGCNVAMRDLHGIDHVALVNNDAVVEPTWLAPLVDALELDPALGAVAPKMLLANPFAELVVHAAAGTEVMSVEVDGLDVTGRCLWGPGVETVPDRSVPLLLRHHLGPESTVAVPVPAETVRWVSATVTLKGDRTFRVDGGDGTEWTSTPIGGDRSRATVTVTAAPTWRVNSLGTDRTAWNEGVERGFGEPDDPNTAPEEPAGWCGGGVLLRSEYLRDVGRFDPKLFAYYEDTDLSWRGQRAGWRYRTEPRSVLRHLHGGSAGSSARGFFLLNYRNWLLTTLRNGEPGQIADTLRWARRAAWGATYLNVVDPLRQRRRPEWTLPAAWAAVAVTTAAGAPRVLWSRSADRGRRTGARPTRRVRSMLQARPAPRPPAPRLGGPTVVYLDATTALAGHAGTDDGRRTAALLRQLPLAADIDAVAVAWSAADGTHRRLGNDEWACLLADDRRAAPVPHRATARRLVLPRWERGATFLDVGREDPVGGAGEDRRTLYDRLRASGVRIVWFAPGEEPSGPTSDTAWTTRLERVDAVLCETDEAAATMRSRLEQHAPARCSEVVVRAIAAPGSTDPVEDRVAGHLVDLDRVLRPAVREPGPGPATADR
jgi:GT2 family glycosyltransferase